MKIKAVMFGAVLLAAIGAGIFMQAGFAEETKNIITLPPTPCVCSAPADLPTLANRSHGRESSLKSNLEPRFLMSLYNCQCGTLSCAVNAQAISCRN